MGRGLTGSQPVDLRLPDLPPYSPTRLLNTTTESVILHSIHGHTSMYYYNSLYLIFFTLHPRVDSNSSLDGNTVRLQLLIQGHTRTTSVSVY